MEPKEMIITASDGTKIPAVIYNYTGEKSVKGIVVIIHGFGEHTGGYRELAEYLGRNDYASVIFDQRGHGSLSDYPAEKRKKYYGVIPS